MTIAIRQLQDVCAITMGQAPDGESHNEKGLGLPLIAGAGDFGTDFPEAKKFTSAPTKTCAQGDIIMSIRATIGTKVLSNGVYCLGRGVAALRPNRLLDARYLWHWLGHAGDSLAARGRGATFLQVSRDDIGKLEIPLPALDEQRRIATILDTADALRRKRKCATDLLRLARDAFVAQELSTSKNKVDLLGNSLAFLTTGGRNWSQYYSDGGDRFIRSLDVQMNAVSGEAPVYVVPPDNAEARRTRTEAGDVLLTVTGSRIGRVTTLPPGLAGSYVSQHVAILRPNQSRVRAKFLAYFLSSERGQRQIQKWQYGQTKPGLNFQQIERFEIPSLSVEQQIQFEKRVDFIEALSARQEDSRKDLDVVFSSLQHRAFSGQL